MKVSRLHGVSLLICFSAAAHANGADRAASAGLQFNALYTGEPIRNLTGGLRTGGTYLDNLDLQLFADRGAVFGIPGLSALLYGLYNNSNQFSEKYVGDEHIVSNIDAPKAWRVYEAWLDWAAPGEADAFSTRIGLYDLNSEFDYTETGGLFLNGAQGMGTDFSQSGENGPSIFPITSLAVRLRVAGVTGFYGQVAVLDGVPGDPDDPSSNEIDLASDDGALIVGEGGWAGGGWRKLAIGLWHYTADFDRLAAVTPAGDPVRDDGNSGWYVNAERTLWSGDGGTAAGFLRYGQADDRFNTFDAYLGAGASLTGFWSSRADDAIGFAVATASTGDRYREAQRLAGSATDAHESSIELTYRASITDWLILQPDVQYIVHPGTSPALDNAVTISLRFELSFSRRLTGS